MSNTTSHIVIVGGGITGLVTAYALLHQPWSSAELRPQITLLEASSRFGGKVRPIDFVGASFDCGAEGLQLLPDAQRLCQQLELTDKLITQQPYKSYIWTRKHMYPMPAGMMMGIPTSVTSIVRSRILTIPGMLRAGLDLILPRTQYSEDPTVGEVIGARLGQDVLDHLVEPLLAGIHSGDINRLSLRATVPQIADVALKNRSLVVGLQKMRKALPAPPKEKGSKGKTGRRRGGLYSFDEGLSRLADELHKELRDKIDLRAEEAVTELTRQGDGSSYQLMTSRGETITAQQVILAIPARPAATVLEKSDPQIAEDMRAIEHSSVVVAHLAYRASAFDPRRSHVRSFLTPSSDGHLLKSGVNATTKWARTQPRVIKDANGDELVILRCSSGRAGDERALHMSDEEITAAFHKELVEIFGLKEQPLASHIVRWTDAFTQYNSGSKERLVELEQRLAQALPGVILAGGDYHGSGLSSCIKDGFHIADLVQQRLDHVTVPA